MCAILLEIEKPFAITSIRLHAPIHPEPPNNPDPRLYVDIPYTHNSHPSRIHIYRSIFGCPMRAHVWIDAVVASHDNKREYRVTPIKDHRNHEHTTKHTNTRALTHT